ncbi:MAG TPA: hypothetical protein V6D23_09420, partial [Candidatus Obscuribacterales bacterium]
DFDKGTLNDVGLTASLNTVKRAFPCPFSSTVDKRGTSLYYGAQNFMFVPGHSISVFNTGKHFPGTMSKEVLGKTAPEIGFLLGAPADTIRVPAGGQKGQFYSYAFYPRAWGTLILKFTHFQPATVEEVVLSRQQLDVIRKMFKK